MAAASPSPNKEATPPPFSYDSGDIESRLSSHDAGSKSQPQSQKQSQPLQQQESQPLQQQESQPPQKQQESEPLQQPESQPQNWNKNLQVISKYLLILLLIAGVTAAVDALGILPAKITAVLLVVSLIPYCFTRPAQILRGEELQQTKRYITGVAFSLFVALIVLLLIFLLDPGLKERKLAGYDVWMWSVAALVSGMFGVIWTCGNFLRTYVQRAYDDNQVLVYFVNASRWAVNCMCFFGGELIVIYVFFKSDHQPKIHVPKIYKWIAVIDLIICGCHVIRIVTRLMIPFLDLYQENGTTSDKMSSYDKYVIYMAKGLRGSINAVLFMVMILLTWCFYVDRRLKFWDDEDDKFKYAKGTFLALLVGSVLWLLKNFLLLLWEAREFYERISDRMLKAAMQLYFLIMIIGLEEDKLVKDDDRATKPSKDSKLPHVPSVLSDCIRGTDNDGGGCVGETTEMKQGRKKRTPLISRDIILRKIVDRQVKKETLTYDLLQELSGCLVATDKLWTRKEDEEFKYSVSSQISKFRKKWKEQYPNGEDGKVTMDELKEKLNKMNCRSKNKELQQLNDKDLKDLEEQLKDEDRTREDVWYGDLEKWLMRAHKNCQTIGRALAGNREAVVYLNRIMAVAIVIAVVIVWLFLVQLTTMEIIAAIFSPLIAIAFIFGDSAKTIFQGMVFAFGVHPFDVGDVCVIDGTQTLEVKKLGIWTTTFLKEGCKDEEVIYPNSALATATIVKHKSILDMSDYLEFSVSKDVPVKKLKKIKEDIETYLKSNEEKFEMESSQVVVKEIGDTVKIGIHFKHLMSFHSMTYLECLNMKNETNSELLQEIKLLVDDCEKNAAENEVSGQGGEEVDTTTAKTYQN